ncbi:MAG: spinster family MFS transporter [Pseudomonadales bacterium]
MRDVKPVSSAAHADITAADLNTIPEHSGSRSAPVADDIKPLDGHRKALTLLVLAYTLSITDRMILSILFPDIKAEFGLSDTQLGLLGGLSFALFYASLGIPIARAADQYNRKIIIVIALVVFSLMTTLSGWASGFIMLLLFRIGVGVGEAGVNPATHSIIADYFPPKRRSFAMAILMLGANLGMMIGFAGGGYVAELYSWRVALMAVGVPGLLLAVVMSFYLREPPRGTLDANIGNKESIAPPPPILTSAVTMWANPAMRHLVAGSTVTGMMSYGLTQWLPTFFVRSHEMSQSQVGIMMAVVFGLLGAAGALTSGRIADKLAYKGFQYGVWVVAASQVMSIPFFMLALLADNLTLAMIFFIIPAFTANFYLGPSLALVQTLAPLRMRAVASAIKMLCLNLIGMGLGPLVVGLLSDLLMPIYGDSALNVALASFTLIGLWGATHFVLCGKALARAR